MKNIFKKTIYNILAFVFLIIGLIGVIIPVLPTTPFLLLTAFFFARGSQKFNKWFISSKLYKKYLDNYLTNKSMTLKNKVKILTVSSILLIIAIYLVNNIYGEILIIFIVICKYYYFIFKINTLNENNKSDKL